MNVVNVSTIIAILVFSTFKFSSACDSILMKKLESSRQKQVDMATGLKKLSNWELLRREKEERPPCSRHHRRRLGRPRLNRFPLSLHLDYRRRHHHKRRPCFTTPKSIPGNTDLDEPVTVASTTMNPEIVDLIADDKREVEAQ